MILKKNSQERKLFYSMIIILSFAVIEVIGGVTSGSLALISDGIHMGSDFFAVLLAWIAVRCTKKPPDSRRSYGYSRIEIITALINSVGLFVIAIFIVVEAIKRIYYINDLQVDPGTMLVVGVIGLLANIAVFLILEAKGDHGLNIKSVILHVLADMVGSAAVVISAVVIMYTDWVFLDPILSIIVSFIVLFSAYKLINNSIHILLEGVPNHIDILKIQKNLQNLIGVINVHHIHIWSLTEDMNVATLHMLIKPEVDREKLILNAKDILSKNFGINHSTIEIEHEGYKCSDKDLCQPKT